MVAASMGRHGSAGAAPVEVRALSHQFVIKGALLPVLADLSFTASREPLSPC